MRKLLLVVVIALHSTFIFTNNSPTFSRELNSIPSSLNGYEKVKIATAIAGCVFFTIGAITTPLLDYVAATNFKLTPENFAATICLMPLCFIEQTCLIWKMKLPKPHARYFRNIGTAYSAIIAYILGKYAYQKIHSQLIHTSNKKEGESPLINDIN